MRLESAQDLKNEVLADLVRPFVEASVSLNVEEATASLASQFGRRVVPMARSAGRARAGSIHRAIAVGVAVGDKDFQLAVRIQRQGLAVNALLDRIRTRAHGEVDIRVIGVVNRRIGSSSTLPWHQADARPMVTGSSIGHFAITAGTLGAFVEKNGKTYVLSNNHVLANENQAQAGDVVLQRAAADGGIVGQQDAALLSEWVPLSLSKPTSCDAAIAQCLDLPLAPGVLTGLSKRANSRIQGLGTPQLNTLVHKVGRTTGATSGRISAISVDNIVTSYSFGNVRFDDCIEIESTMADRPFSDDGDSGSLILDDALAAVGLLFGGTDFGGANDLGLTYAHPLSTVLPQFGVKLLT